MLEATQKSLIPFGTTVAPGRGPNKALSHCQDSLLSKQLYSFVLFKMQHLGKILLNIAKSSSFICFIERGLMERFWEELSQAVRITVSGRLRRNKEGSSMLQVFLWC